MSALWDGPIIDAHQRFWEPWLMPDAAIRFRYGDHSAIKRRYLPDNYRGDAVGAVSCRRSMSRPSGTRRTRSVRRGMPAGWLSGMGCPGAIVAQAWLDRGDAKAVIAAQADFALVRSIRHKPGGPATPEEVGVRTTLMSDPSWRRGYALLERFGLQTPWWNLAEAVRLARDFPGRLIILNHAGLPGDRDAAALGGWRQAMGDFAACPNAVVKVSGMGKPGRAWTAERNEGAVRFILDTFGADRAMFGSNFPVDSLCARFGEIVLGVKRILATYPDDAQAAFFGGTARRIYRLG